jgi:3-oxoacyl-[acyl-carrier protein] reductase
LNFKNGKAVCNLLSYYNSDCQKLVTRTIDKFGQLDYLVNNAGTTKYAFDHSDLDALDTDDFLNIYKTNVIGPYNLIKYAKPHLLLSDSPGIVNVASIAAVTGELVCLWADFIN